MGFKPLKIPCGSAGRNPEISARIRDDPF